MIGVILLVEGDGRLGPSEPHRGDEGVNDIYILLGDAALPARFVHLGALEDLGAMISLKKCGIVL